MQNEHQFKYIPKDKDTKSKYLHFSVSLPLITLPIDFVQCSQINSNDV